MATRKEMVPKVKPGELLKEAIRCMEEDYQTVILERHPGEGARASHIATLAMRSALSMLEIADKIEGRFLYTDDGCVYRHPNLLDAEMTKAGIEHMKFSEEEFLAGHMFSGFTHEGMIAKIRELWPHGELPAMKLRRRRNIITVTRAEGGKDDIDFRYPITEEANECQS